MASKTLTVSHELHILIVGQCSISRSNGAIETELRISATPFLSLCPLIPQANATHGWRVRTGRNPVAPPMDT